MEEVEADDCSDDDVMEVLPSVDVAVESVDEVILGVDVDTDDEVLLGVDVGPNDGLLSGVDVDPDDVLDVGDVFVDEPAADVLEDGRDVTDEDELVLLRDSDNWIVDDVELPGGAEVELIGDEETIEEKLGGIDWGIAIA